MTGYVRLCAADDVAEGTARRVEVHGCPIAVVRSGGQVYAVGDTCTHGQVSLSEGEVEGATLECWLHGSAFDLATGRPLSLPATVPVPTYPVRVEGDAILAQVPESQIPTPGAQAS